MQLGLPNKNKCEEILGELKSTRGYYRMQF